MGDPAEFCRKCCYENNCHYLSAIRQAHAKAGWCIIEVDGVPVIRKRVDGQLRMVFGLYEFPDSENIEDVKERVRQVKEGLTSKISA